LGQVHKGSKAAFGEKSSGSLTQGATLSRLKLLGLIGAIGGTVVGLGKIVSATSLSGDTFQKMSLRTGVLAEDLSTLAFAAERSGTDFTVLEKGLQRMTRNALEASEGVGEASESFDRLGVQAVGADGQLRPSMELMLELSDALKGLSSDSEKAAQAQRLFGRSGADLLPLLKEGSAGIGRLQARARELGLEFSTQQANEAADYRDALLDLGSAWTGMARGLGTELIPKMTVLVKGLTMGSQAAGAFVANLGGMGQMFDSALALSAEFGKSAVNVIDAFFSNPKFRTSFIDSFGDTLLAAHKAHKQFWIDNLNVSLQAAKLIWVPIRQAAEFAWEHIKATSIGTINEVLELFDVDPIAVDAPRSIEAHWAAMKADLQVQWTDLSASGRTLADNLSKGADDVGAAWSDTADVMATQATPEFIALRKKFADELALLKSDLLKIGGIIGANLATGTGQGLQENQEVAVNIPARASGRDMGENLKGGFQSALDQGFKSLLTERSISSAFDDFGKGAADATVDSLAKKLTDETVGLAARTAKPFRDAGKKSAGEFSDAAGDRIASAWSSTGAQAKLLGIAGDFKGPFKEIGHASAAALKTGFDGLGASFKTLGLGSASAFSLGWGDFDSYTFGAKWGVALGGAIKGGLTTFLAVETLASLTGGGLPAEWNLVLSIGTGAIDQLQTELDGITFAGFGQTLGDAATAGLIGANLATLFDSTGEIGAGIGAALGFAIAGPIGAAIGGVGGGLLEGLMFDTQTLKDQEKKSVSEFRAAMLHAGGAQGLISQAGGTSQLVPHLLEQGLTHGAEFTGFASGRELLVRSLVAAGMPYDEAVRTLELIQSGEVLTTEPPPGINGGASSTDPQPSPFAKALPGAGGGGSETDHPAFIPPTTTITRTEKPVAGGGTPATGHPLDITNITQPAEPPNVRQDPAFMSVGAVASKAAQLLGRSQISAGLMAQLKPSDFDQFMRLIRGGFYTGEIDFGTQLAFQTLVSGGTISADQKGALKHNYSIDIVAAQGFHGMVHRPTHILAGEAGSERVDISPMPSAKGFQSMTQGGGQTNFTFNFHITTLDPRGLRDTVKQDIWPMMKELMMSESNFGKPLLNQKGIVNR